MKNFIYIIIMSIVVLAMGYPLEYKTENSREFTFTYNVNLESSNGKKIELWIPVPQSNEVQKITNLKIDCKDLAYEIKDENIHNNKYVYIYSSEGTNEDKAISLQFDVLRIEHSNIQYDGVNPDNYLSDYSMVPTGLIFNDIIKNNNLINTESMVAQSKNVYDYVLSGMHYGKPKSVDNQYYNDPWLKEGEKYGLKEVSRDEVLKMYKVAKETGGNYTFGNGNSLYACDIGVGNCTDYHSYFMSLSRTMQVSTRFHMGFPIPNKSEGAIGGYHCWADYYVEDKGWYPVDISEADKDLNRKEYFFGTVCNNRVEMVVGRDFILEGYDNGVINLFVYPLLEIEDEKSSAFTKSFSFKNI